MFDINCVHNISSPEQYAFIIFYKSIAQNEISDERFDVVTLNIQVQHKHFIDKNNLRNLLSDSYTLSTFLKKCNVCVSMISSGCWTARVLMSLCGGNSSPSTKDQWCGALTFYMLLDWTSPTRQIELQIIGDVTALTWPNWVISPMWCHHTNCCEGPIPMAQIWTDVHTVQITVLARKLWRAFLMAINDYGPDEDHSIPRWRPFENWVVIIWAIFRQLVADITSRSVLWTGNVQCIEQHTRQTLLTYTQYLLVNGGVSVLKRYARSPYWMKVTTMAFISLHVMNLCMSHFVTKIF